MIKYTTRLYAMPSWISGAARILDLGATFDDYNFSESPEEADYLALASDWAAVGADIQLALDNYKVQKDGIHGEKQSEKSKPTS